MNIKQIYQASDRKKIHFAIVDQAIYNARPGESNGQTIEGQMIPEEATPSHNWS